MNEVETIWTGGLAGFDAAWEVRLGPRTLAVRDPHRCFNGASMVTTLLAALLDEDVDAGRVPLTRTVGVTRAQLNGEDGLLRHGQVPTVHRLCDLILLMVAVSDHTATNTLLEFLGGPDAVNARFAARGWASRVLRPVGDPGPDGALGFSSVSVADHQAALAQIVNPLILGAFAAQQDRRALARGVAHHALFRHTTGADADARHDAGVLITPRGPLWVACFTAGGPHEEYVDHPARVAMGRCFNQTLSAFGLSALVVPHSTGR